MQSDQLLNYIFYIVLGIIGTLLLFNLVQVILIKSGVLPVPVDRTTREEAAALIDRFLLSHEPGSNIREEFAHQEFNWFCGTDYFADSLVQEVANECAGLYEKYPFGDEGFDRLGELREQLIAEGNEGNNCL